MSGGLNHQKNPLFLIEIFAALAQRDPAWKLLLVGGGEMEPDIRAAVARHGLQDRVLFAGVQDDVPAYMNAFDLFLLPSNFEGSPVTLVEAQGCGVPCLASTNVPDDGAVTGLVHFLPLERAAGRMGGHRGPHCRPRPARRPLGRAGRRRV